MLNTQQRKQTQHHHLHIQAATCPGYMYAWVAIIVSCPHSHHQPLPGEPCSQRPSVLPSGKAPSLMLHPFGGPQRQARMPSAERCMEKGARHENGALSCLRLQWHCTIPSRRSRGFQDAGQMTTTVTPGCPEDIEVSYKKDIIHLRVSHRLM